MAKQIAAEQINQANKLDNSFRPLGEGAANRKVCARLAMQSVTTLT